MKPVKNFTEYLKQRQKLNPTPVLKVHDVPLYLHPDSSSEDSTLTWFWVSEHPTILKSLFLPNVVVGCINWEKETIEFKARQADSIIFKDIFTYQFERQEFLTSTEFEFMLWNVLSEPAFWEVYSKKIR